MKERHFDLDRVSLFGSTAARAVGVSSILRTGVKCETTSGPTIYKKLITPKRIRPRIERQERLAAFSRISPSAIVAFPRVGQIFFL
jgi:hypothetical protein